VACASDPYPDAEKYGALRAVIAAKDWDGVLARLKEAELRGMGGAGFPTSMKWDLVRKQAVARNTSFATRMKRAGNNQGSLHHDAPAALAGGRNDSGRAGDRSEARDSCTFATNIICRKRFWEKRFAERIARLAGEEYFGQRAGIRAAVFVSPGGYICGEESALIEAIEGTSRGAAEQAAVSGSGWFVAEADGDQQRRDVHQCAADSGARSGVVQSGGAERFARTEICGSERTLREPGIYEVPLGITMPGSLVLTMPEECVAGRH
jgi:NADH:ubiquinone oxidoreductase subunit F (NADH-binding)